MPEIVGYTLELSTDEASRSVDRFWRRFEEKGESAVDKVLGRDRLAEWAKQEEDSAKRRTALHDRLAQDLISDEERITRRMQQETQRRLEITERAFQRQRDMERSPRKATAGLGGYGTVNAIYQAQQAIEDFAYAGIRGAADNIAFLAAQFGGPAGLIALVGTAGYQLYQLATAEGRVTDATDSAAEAQKSFVELLERRLQLQQRIVDAVSGTDLSKPDDQLAEAERRLKSQQQRLQSLGGFDPFESELTLQHEINLALEKRAPILEKLNRLQEGQIRWQEHPEKAAASRQLLGPDVFDQLIKKRDSDIKTLQRQALELDQESRRLTQRLASLDERTELHSAGQVETERIRVLQDIGETAKRAQQLVGELNTELSRTEQTVTSPQKVLEERTAVLANHLTKQIEASRRQFAILQKDVQASLGDLESRRQNAETDGERFGIGQQMKEESQRLVQAAKDYHTDPNLKERG